MKVLVRNMTRILTTCVTFLLWMSCLTGCGTFVARSGMLAAIGGPPRYYPATCLDATILVDLVVPEKTSGGFPVRLGRSCLGLLDMPISLVTDTLWLPFDIWAYEPSVFWSQFEWKSDE
jgi:uncharacterized protein YceK